MKNQLNIALMGNPNSGKSTLFNSITGLNQKIGNFPGVTVEKKIGKKTYQKYKLTFIDLPGCYSLFPNSIDEKIAIDIVSNKSNKNYPDLIIAVIDATSLKKHLFLVTQLIDLKIPVILAINLLDLAKKKGIEINTIQLSQTLQVPCIEINAKKKEGLDNLLKEVITFKKKEKKEAFTKIDLKESLLKDIDTESNYHALIQIINNYKDFKLKEINPIRLKTTETVRRQKFIAKIINSCYKKNPEKSSSYSEILDKAITHKFFGYIIFFFIMFIMFQSLFSLAKYPMEWIETTFQKLSLTIQNTLPENQLTDLFTNGILAGLEGVLIFIPQIALLFAFINILEETGYMARVSFIMDKIMRKFGLNGKSIVPLISGMACAIPAIMSTRNISSQKERLITILVTPFMSCAARLPVYTLLIALVIPESEKIWFFNAQGLTLFFLYFLGVFAVLTTGFALKKSLHIPSKDFFMMELPSYKTPNWHSIFINMYEKSKTFMFDAGKIIIAISIILWGLSSYGPRDKMDKIENEYSMLIEKNQLQSESLNIEMNSKKLESSYAGIIGKSIEPIIKPLGFDWKMGIAIITSFAAREVFVGTMATIYSVEQNNSEFTLREKMANQINPATGKKQYSLAVGISLMIFYAFAMQCMSTLAVVYQETNSWKWPLTQFVFMGLLAYFASWISFSIFN